MKNYLTEQALGECLKKVFPNNVFIHDKTIPNSGTKSRPDYRCDELMLIVEFDGYHHYSQAARIIKDVENDETYKQMGYKVVRIPYFIQWSSEVVEFLFNIIDETILQTYKHGFISDKAMLPADFCSLGITKFERDLKKFDFIGSDIILSLLEKKKKLGNILFVIPTTLIFP